MFPPTIIKISQTVWKYGLQKILASGNIMKSDSFFFKCDTPTALIFASPNIIENSKTLRSYGVHKNLAKNFFQRG